MFHYFIFPGVVRINCFHALSGKVLLKVANFLISLLWLSLKSDVANGDSFGILRASNA